MEAAKARIESGDWSIGIGTSDIDNALAPSAAGSELSPGALDTLVGNPTASVSIAELRADLEETEQQTSEGVAIATAEANHVSASLRLRNKSSGGGGSSSSKPGGQLEDPDPTDTGEPQAGCYAICNARC